MAFSSADVLRLMAAEAQLPLEALRVDGGAAANDWLMQFQADILGIAVERPSNVETTALGAGGLAGLAVGVWRSAEEFLAAQRFTRFEPVMPGPDRRLQLQGWQRAVDTALAWARAPVVGEDITPS
jgi:glycerol kinase